MEQYKKMNKQVLIFLILLFGFFISEIKTEKKKSTLEREDLYLLQN